MVTGNTNMGKQQKIECPDCGRLLAFSERELPDGLVDPLLTPEDKAIVFTVECLNCKWSRVITPKEVQQTLLEPSKGYFKAFWSDEN